MKKYSLLFLLLAAGCDKYYLSVQQQYIDANYLASTHVGTPDPLKENPPTGQEVIIEWRVPRKRLNENLKVALRVIYWNHTEKCFYFPIDYSHDYQSYMLLGEDYEKTGGILTYRAQIVNDRGDVYRDWVHQLWVRLISVEEVESSSCASSTNSSVVVQPIQGSVTETPYLSEEERD